MKKILLLLLAGLSLTAAAQHVSVTSKTRLLEGVEGPAYRPVLSPDGSQLLFAAGENGGLKMLDFNSGVVTRVSDTPSAGTDAFWGGDGMVYYVGQERRSNNLVYRTGYAYNPATAQTEVVLEAQHGAVLPVHATRGAALKGSGKSFAKAINRGTAVYTAGAELFITRNGVTRSYTPVPSHAGYLWASLSPDGTRVAFYAAARGICVTDLDGNLLAEIGNYEMPCWYDNDYIIAQNATDDGHQFTSSQILILKADGSFKTALTTPTSMAMQPTAAAGKIVYTTIDGLLYQINISINP